MKSRKILITGGSSQIGYYCAKKSQDDGHFVVITCLKIEEVENLTLQGFNAVHLDLSDNNSVVEAVKKILIFTNGALDILINNASYGQASTLKDIYREVLEQQFVVNVFGTHQITRELIKYLINSPYPRIIQMNSALGLVALRYSVPYVAVKFALEGISDTLRLELSDTEIKVSLIEPGPITTDIKKNSLPFLLKILIWKDQGINQNISLY